MSYTLSDKCYRQVDYLAFLNAPPIQNDRFLGQIRKQSLNAMIHLSTVGVNELPLLAQSEPGCEPTSAVSKKRILHSQAIPPNAHADLLGLILVPKKRFGHKVDEHAYFG